MLKPQTSTRNGWGFFMPEFFVVILAMLVAMIVVQNKGRLNKRSN